MLQQLLQSKKFLVAAGTSIAAALVSIFSNTLHLSPDQAGALATKLIISGSGYCLGQGFADWGKEGAKLTAAASAQAIDPIKGMLQNMFNQVGGLVPPAAAAAPETQGAAVAPPAASK